MLSNRRTPNFAFFFRTLLNFCGAVLPVWELKDPWIKESLSFIANKASTLFLSSFNNPLCSGNSSRAFCSTWGGGGGGGDGWNWPKRQWVCENSRWHQSYPAPELCCPALSQDCDWGPVYRCQMAFRVFLTQIQPFQAIGGACKQEPAWIFSDSQICASCIGKCKGLDKSPDILGKFHCRRGLWYPVIPCRYNPFPLCFHVFILFKK